MYRRYACMQVCNYGSTGGPVDVPPFVMNRHAIHQICGIVCIIANRRFAAMGLDLSMDHEHSAVGANHSLGRAHSPATTLLRLALPGPVSTKTASSRLLQHAPRRTGRTRRRSQAVAAAQHTCNTASLCLNQSQNAKRVRRVLVSLESVLRFCGVCDVAMLRCLVRNVEVPGLPRSQAFGYRFPAFLQPSVKACIRQWLAETHVRGQADFRYVTLAGSPRQRLLNRLGVVCVEVRGSSCGTVRGLARSLKYVFARTCLLSTRSCRQR